MPERGADFLCRVVHRQEGLYRLDPPPIGSGNQRAISGELEPGGAHRTQPQQRLDHHLRFVEAKLRNLRFIILRLLQDGLCLLEVQWHRHHLAAERLHDLLGVEWGVGFGRPLPLRFL